MTEQRMTIDEVLAERAREQESWKVRELKALHGAAMQFDARAKSLNLKGAKLAVQMEAFYEGAINVAVNLGYVSSERAGIINFMCSVGRLGEMHKMWLEKSL